MISSIRITNIGRLRSCDSLAAAASRAEMVGANDSVLRINWIGVNDRRN